MTTRNERLFGLRVATSIGTLYTAPGPTGGNTNAQTLFTFINVSFNQSSRISMWIVPSGDSPDGDNVIWDDVQVDDSFQAARAVYWVLEPGDTVQAIAEKFDTITLRGDGLRIDE